MVLPLFVPLLGMIGVGAGVGVGGGIFSRLRKQPTQTQQVTSTIKTVAIMGGVLVGIIFVTRAIK